MEPQRTNEDAAGTRFAFGKNWLAFLEHLDDARILLAEQSLRSMLDVDHLQGQTFLDIGSGSGLFSLAARRLGATVHSFDYDTQSVACTEELKRRYFDGDPAWVVERGSILDEAYVASLGTFDVVYSWGVLHHTGRMDEACALAADTVAPGGQFFIAIYNDQGFISTYWSAVKRVYNRSTIGRVLMTALHAPYLFGVRWVVRALTGRLSLERGMSLWHDMTDWLGGYPFEVARPEVVSQFFRDRGFELTELRRCGRRMGCNEFVMRRVAGAPSASSASASR